MNAESNGDTNLDELGGAFVDANSQLEKEGMDVERAISGITEVQVCEILRLVVRYSSLVVNYFLTIRSFADERDSREDCSF